MRRFFKKIHKYISIPIGVIITITCLTGAILVFQDEILELSNPSHYFVSEVKAKPIPLNELVPLVNKQLTNNKVSAVKISSDPQRTYTMTLAEGFRVSAFVDPYTAEVKAYYSVKESGFFTVMSLHRWLMDGSRTVGKYTVGIATLLLVFVLITGIIIWFPKNKKQWKSAFSLKLKGVKAKRLFYDFHRILGIYASLLLLICALTGLMWSFDWYRNSVFSIFGAEIPEQAEKGKGRGDKKKEKTKLDTQSWQYVADNLQTNNPQNEYIRIEDGKAVVHQKYMITSRAVDEYSFDSSTGGITKTVLYESQPTASKVWGWAYSLHVGNYWGIWSKILTCLASLIGASLPITGYYLSYKKRKKKRSKAQ